MRSSNIDTSSISFRRNDTDGLRSGAHRNTGQHPALGPRSALGRGPGQSIIAGPNGDRLAPRKSFEAWSETVRDRSRPWSDVEIEAATVLRVALLELVLQRVDEVSRERMAARANQNLLMAELDHRVKNSLATIQSMVRFSSRSATDLVSFVTSIESRLQSMAKAHNLLTNSRWQGASLGTGRG